MRAISFIACLAVLSVAVLTVAPSEANAGRRIVVINTGSDVFDTGPIPEPYASDAKYKNWTAGYECSIFGVFWIYLHWWNCQPVAYSHDSYDASPEMAKAIGEKYSKSEMKIPPLQKYGRWGIGLIC